MTATEPETKDVTLAHVVEKLEELRRIMASQSAELMTGPAAARYLGITPKALQRLSRLNVLLRPVKLETGGRRYRKRDLDAYIEKMRK